MSIVLVTGASGFIGRHAILALNERGFTVHAVSRHQLADLPAIWHEVDLFDAEGRRFLFKDVRPTHLLHLAWEARHGHYPEALENLDWVTATLDIVRQFRSAGGLRAVFAGSCAEYDWRPHALTDGVCREFETPCKPATLYGLCKNATHDLIAAYAIRSRFSYAWARIFFVYGPFEVETRLIPTIIRALLVEKEIDLGNKETVRDFMSVWDAARALAALLASSAAGPVNIASGMGVTLDELAHRIATLTGGDEGFLRFGARPSAAENPPRLLADVSRLRQETDFVPSRDLVSALASSVAFWQQKRQVTGRHHAVYGDQA